MTIHKLWPSKVDLLTATHAGRALAELTGQARTDPDLMAAYLVTYSGPRRRLAVQRMAGRSGRPDGVGRASSGLWRPRVYGSKQGSTGGAGPGTALSREERAVYARSTTFHGRPDNIDAGISFVKNEAGPMLESIEGCRGLSMLVDRETGRCIATSSWESEAAMRASDERLRPFRDRGRDILGGSMQVDEWEIVVMHRTHHGECCRVSWLQGDLDALADTFRVGILSELEQTPGFCGASLLVNWSTGLGCATTTWESRAAMESSRSVADDMRSRAASDARGEIVDVQEFDLAYAHLHVPEMA